MNYLRPASRTSIYLATMQLVIDRHFFSVLLEGRSFLPEGPSHIQDLVLPAGQRLCTKVLPEALLAGQAAVRSIINMLMVSVLFFKKASANLVEILTASVIGIEVNFPNSLNVSRFFRRTLYAVFFYRF
jgi:hypothetical protein